MMVLNKRILAVSAVVLCLVVLNSFFGNCSPAQIEISSTKTKASEDPGGGGTTAGNPKPTIEIAPFQLSPTPTPYNFQLQVCAAHMEFFGTLTAAQLRPKPRFNLIDLFLPRAMAVGFGALPPPPSIDPTQQAVGAPPPPSTPVATLDFTPAMKILPPAGSGLGEFNLPLGQFSQVEMVLDGSCQGGQSMVLTNAHGTHSTTSTIDMIFSGNVVISNDTQKLVIDISNQILLLENATSGSVLESFSEMTAGTVTAQ